MCAALLVAFATLSWMSWSKKGVTVDEPVHFVSAWLTTRDGDYQTDPENPPLWKRWVMLPQIGRELKLDRATLYDRILPTDRFAFYRWAPDQLFEHNDDGDAFIRRSRGAMLVIGVLLGAVIAAFAWRIAGPVAGVAALVLFAFDPNFLAHSPLVKNDVIVTLCWLCATAGLWSIGKRVRVTNVALICAACTAGVLSKFTGVFLLPLVVLLIGIRASQQKPPRSRSIYRGAGLILLVFLITYVGIWAGYGFRFSPSKDHPVDTSLDRLIATIARNEWIADTGQFAASAPPEVLARWHKPLDVRALEWFHDAHLLPHAFVDGMLSTKASAMVRPAFLFGNLNFTGWWYYYPVVFLVKTPLAMLIAFAIVAVLALRRRNSSSDERWTRICLATSGLLYVLISMTSSVNVGVRHLFPIYPLLYVATGCAVARLWANRRARIVTLILGAGLVVETLVAFPNYIPFFNVLAGGSRGGVNILSDSNIDWGQDVPLLAQWQHDHPDELLQVGCFSVVDPAHYGIRSLPLPGGPSSAGTPHWPPHPGIVAVSATNLQGAYRMFWPRGEDLYAPFRAQKPIAVLGGSIYLYRVQQ